MEFLNRKATDSVRERGWSSQKYQDWLGDALVHALLKTKKKESR